MELRVGQQFRVPSAIAQGYEELVGEFSFVVEISSLELAYHTHSIPAVRDIYLKLIDCTPYNGFHIEPHYAAYCISHGHDKYEQLGATYSINYSPDLVAGDGSSWFLPDLFRWQNKFYYLYLYDIIELMPHNLPQRDKPIIKRY